MRRLPLALFHRRVAAMACVFAALSACAVEAPAMRAEDRALWPDPAPQPGVSGQLVVLPRSRMPVAFAPLQVRPNFRAPSADSCVRPIQTREVPGRAAGQEPLADAAMAPRPGRSGAGAPMPVPAPAAPPPSATSRADIAEAAVPAAMAERAELFRKAETESRSRKPTPLPAPQAAPQQPAPGPVTAGVVNDNADFAEYLAFRQRTQVHHRSRDVRERYLLQVRDAHGRGVADAEVLVRSPQGQAAWARTDTAGNVWLHPDAFDAHHAQVYEVTARQQGQQARAYLQRGQKSAVELRLDAAPVAQQARLDLVFLVDATGSMGDEIDKLRNSLRSIADEVAALPSRPDLCFALVAYRDKGDAFLLRSHDFTNDLGAFQGVLNRLHANGGGDYPEALNEALHETVHNLAWRGDGTTRMVLLLADAPPHLDYGGPQYDDSMVAALGKGIKVFSVGASGLDRQGEYIQRQIAQYTGGRFVFLTYADAARPSSGPGRETAHDVRNYSVDTLDSLIVRLVSEELAPLQPGQGSAVLGYNTGLR